LEKSIAFLQEGLRNNPKSIDILTQIAYCHLKVLPKANKLTRDYRAALTYIVAAREIGKDNFDILTEQELDALKQNYWRMVICFRELNDYKQMLRAAREGAAMYPDDAVLARHVVEAERLCAGKFTEIAPVIIAEPADSDL
jgi:tetratricopeptide (TPR) repeat protein